MNERIPSNIIVKSIFHITRPYLLPKYIPSVINDIISYIYQTEPMYYDNLEIEAKLGHFEFKGTKLNGYYYINEAFRIPDFPKIPQEFGMIFKSGLGPEKFYLIWSAIQNESKIINSGIKDLGAQTFKEIHYKSGKRSSLIYKEGKLVKEEIIKKEGKRHFNIRNCGNDFRITCSKEMPTEILEDEDVIEMKREKFRVSYHFSFYRLDFTITNSSNESFLSYEIEIEINQIKELLKNNNGKINYDEISTVLERFMQNILNLYTATTPESFSFISSKKENKFKNQFGNYLEHNVKSN